MNATRLTKWAGLVMGLLLAATPAWAGTVTHTTTVTRTTTHRPVHVREGEVNYTGAYGRHYEAEGIVVTRGRPVTRTTTVEKQTTVTRGR
jgi:hypothetical protein